MSGSLLRVSTATAVAIVPPGPKTDVVETLSALSRAGVRSILISLGDGAGTERYDEDGTIVIEKLHPKFLDNAVACLRLSSLPTLAWWRVPAPAMLHDLADLVDRLVLDVDDPTATWPLVPDLAPLAPVSDLRWTRLTRWRALIAQFFDLPEVRESADTFARVEVAGSDRFDTRLLAGWLKARLPSRERLEVLIDSTGSAAIESIRLSGPQGSLGVERLGGSPCLETFVTLGKTYSSRRAVETGDQRPLALIEEELRVRSRDLAFEDAVREAERL